MSIYIFSRPIHSGKTTALRQWCDQQINLHGVLMPDINGSRKILDLHSNAVFDIECTDTVNTKERLTSVGKFHFYTVAFEKANRIITSAIKQKPGWLVIDEAGKLELDSEGFYPGIKKAVDFYSDKDISGNLLITVRDSLCADVIKFFRLKDYKIVLSLDSVI